MDNRARKRLSLGLATLCLALSVLSVAQVGIVEYNKSVSREQFESYSVAEWGKKFNYDVFPNILDYRVGYRNLILLLCIIGFSLSWSTRTVSYLLLPYILALLLVYQWISVTVRALSTNEQYMADSPYLLRIATPVEWALFASLITTFGVNAFLLLRRRG